MQLFLEGTQGRLPSICAKKILRGLSYTNWDDMVAIVAEPTRRGKKYVQLIWLEDGEITEQPIKMIQKRCPQKVNYLCGNIGDADQVSKLSQFHAKQRQLHASLR
jgi:hypothetical protein